MSEWDELPETDFTTDPEAIIPGRERVRAMAIPKIRALTLKYAHRRAVHGALRSAQVRTDRADKLLRDFSGGE